MIRIIYIHGFLSSPESFKAASTKRWLLGLLSSGLPSSNKRGDQHKRIPAGRSFSLTDIEFICPQLSSYPDEALHSLRELCEEKDRDKTFLIGSSLGGFWASYLIEQNRAHRAVLINPAVSPHERFVDLVGKDIKSYYGDKVYRLRDEDIQVLASSESRTLRDASRYWLMVQTGDEVLDYRVAEQRYIQCKKTIEEGGNHSFEGYVDHLPQILDFFMASSAT